MADHNQDSDCVTDADGTCTICGVHHGCPCETCGGAGFHKDNCEATKAQYAEEQALATRFPIGARVRVIRSDLDVYVGLTGTVLNYDLSISPDEPSLVGVSFDTPVTRTDLPPDAPRAPRDGFYDDELVLLDAPSAESNEDARLLAGWEREKEGQPTCGECGGTGEIGDGPTCEECSGTGFYNDTCAVNESEHLLAEKERLYAVFMAAIDASNAAQNHVMHARDAYLAAAERADKMR